MSFVLSKACCKHRRIFDHAMRTSCTWLMFFPVMCPSQTQNKSMRPTTISQHANIALTTIMCPFYYALLSVGSLFTFDCSPYMTL